MNKKGVFLIWFFVAVLIIGYGISKTTIFEGLFNKEQAVEEQSQQEVNEGEVINISDISDEMKGIIVTVVAKVTDINEHKNGHLFLTVKDTTGEIAVPIFADKDIDHSLIKENKTYKIRGKVDIYNGSLEIIPEEQDDIVLTGNDENTTEITKENINKEVTINCTVLSKYDHPDGHIFLNVLTDAGDEIEIPIFSNLDYDEEIDAGDYIEVRGKISEYKEKLEVIPNVKSDIEIISKGSADEVQLVPISQISEADRGKMVQVRGIPTDITEKNGHMFLYLEDGNSKIKTVLFKADGKEIEGRKDKLRYYEGLNKPVRVLATVDVYNGELELIIDKVFNND